MNKPGKITQIIGAVIDVSFEGDLPEIYTALQVDNQGNKLILEVAQHLGVSQLIEKKVLKKMMRIFTNLNRMKMKY